ncbi:MAG: DTW domain-containing protein [Candidatus Wallbacteria bacterium]|nr:DTW domain-containing protein [Candidatus Wallbacteria bacterium]
MAGSRAQGSLDPHKRAKRCAVCRKGPSVCFCGDVRVLQTRSRLPILQHPTEIWRPSATAKIVELALAGSRLFVRGDAEDEAELEGLLEEPGSRPYLVFPDSQAPEPAQMRAAGAWAEGPPPTFLLLDGSWRQARRMRHRRPWLARLPVVALRPSEDSVYRIRRQAHSGNLSTVEAAALLMSQVEERPERFEHLLELLDLMVTRILRLRGLDREGQPIRAAGSE